MIEKELVEKIKNIENFDFEEIALQIFNFQYHNNPIYKKYIDFLGINISKITNLKDIPFLPIQFFKTKKIVSKYYDLSDKNFTIFQSSGTTGMIRSKHYIYDIELYKHTFFKAFKKFFGEVNNYCILALLPSYLEAGNSSLVFMVDELIKRSCNESGFYLNNTDELKEKLDKLYFEGKKVILWGVSYALIDFSKKADKKYDNLIIIETGGMKGRRKEITREELHDILKTQFGVEKIYSEYGMTELLSQAYSMGDGLYKCSDTMKILIKDINDPFSNLPENKAGIINIVDLSNIYSCSFIETKDLGKIKNDRFEILGRVDESDIRGCNLLIL